MDVPFIAFLLIVIFGTIGFSLSCIFIIEILINKLKKYKRAKSNWESIKYTGDDYGVIIQRQVDDYDQFIYRINIFNRYNGHVDNVDVPLSEFTEKKVK